MKDMIMKDDLDPTIITELTRRAKIIEQHALPGDIGTGMSGSNMCWSMTLCVIGPSGIKNPDWHDVSMQSPVMSVEEYMSGKYHTIIDELHRVVFHKINGLPLGKPLTGCIFLFNENPYPTTKEFNEEKEILESWGAWVREAFTSDVTHLLVTSHDVDSPKVQKAKERNIPILDVSEFCDFINSRY